MKCTAWMLDKHIQAWYYRPFLVWRCEGKDQKQWQRNAILWWPQWRNSMASAKQSNISYGKHHCAMAWWKISREVD